MNMKYYAISLVFSLGSTVLAQDNEIPFPTKTPLPLGADSFCAGFKNMFSITKQEFRQEAAIICPDLKPSQVLRDLIANPYTSTVNPSVTIQQGICDQTPNLCIDASGSTVTDRAYSGIIATYAMRVPLSPVATLLGEEDHVATPYNNRPIQEISSKWIDPPANVNDADTAFAVEQHTVVTGAVEFDDRSIHDLKLYRLQPNNVDFFAAVRTLRQSTTQFRHSVVLRGVMRDPNDPKYSLSITVQHMIMKNHGRHDRVVSNYTLYLQNDMETLYAKQSAKAP